MAIVKVTAEGAKRLRSNIERIREMTDEEIEKAAEEDPDNPPWTDEEIASAKPAVHRGGGVYANEKSKRGES